MAKTDTLPFADFIRDLDINGMGGRMVLMPATSRKSRDILFVYGQHASLEQWEEVIRLLSRYGNVTAPDLPGFGGMDSLFMIDRKPTIDVYADYLASFMKLKYRHRGSVMIVAAGYGMVVATRMLARYPSVRSRVRGLVSLGGWVRYDDFDLTSGVRRRNIIKYALIGSYVISPLVRLVCFNHRVLPKLLERSLTRRGVLPDDRDARAGYITAEGLLWRQNDLRTHIWTARELLQFDNCARQLEVPLWHLPLGTDTSDADQRREQRLRVAYADVELLPALPLSVLPPVIDPATAKKLIPAQLRRILARPPAPLP